MTERRAVQDTSELRRILALPTRTGSTDDLIDALSQFLRKPHVCGPDCAGGVVRLLPLQANALIEAHDYGGLFLQGPIGCGKTLAGFLLAALFQAKRPVLVIPGGMREETVLKLKKLRQHWAIPAIEIVSYEFLSIEAHVKFFEEFNPDLIVFDESHKCKNPKAAITRRVKRLLSDHHVPVCVMSGSPAKRSIKDFAHTMRWALRDLCPLPIVESNLADWASVVDSGLNAEDRLDPGALRVFGNHVQQIRIGMRKRIFSTPGAICSDHSHVDAKLKVHLVNLPLSQAEDIHYKRLYEDWETPDGHQFFDAIEMWAQARRLAMGYFGVWDPRPPQDWMEARKEWYATCRKILSKSRKLDTEKMVASHIDRTVNHPATEILVRWRALKASFVPNSVPRWIGSTALDYAASWAKGGGIIWTEHVAFGLELSRRTGIPYFGEEGLTPDGRHFICTYKGPVMIASWHANGTGRDGLQRYNRGLLTSMWPTATWYDQTMGRQHRQGQKSPIVTFDIPISCREQLAGFERASKEDGPFHRDLLSIPSKLAVDGCFTSDVLGPRHGYAWAFPRQRG